MVGAERALQPAADLLADRPAPLVRVGGPGVAERGDAGVLVAIDRGDLDVGDLRDVLLQLRAEPIGSDLRRDFGRPLRRLALSR